jgi:hypothetical protein
MWERILERQPKREGRDLQAWSQTSERNTLGSIGLQKNNCLKGTESGIEFNDFEKKDRLTIGPNKNLYLFFF